MSAEGSVQCHCKATLNNHCDWRNLLRTGRKEMSFLYSRRAKGRSGEVQAGQPYLNPEESDGTNSSRSHLQTYEGQEVDLHTCM